MRVPYPKTFASALKETYLTSKQKYPLNGKARITKAVNGGKNGLEDRIINFNYYKKLLGVK
jgi:predicted chitinase